MEKERKKNITINKWGILSCFFLILLLFFSYFYFSNSINKKRSYDEKEKEIAIVINDCVSLCKKMQGIMDYSNGPCLSDHANMHEWNHTDWVCDIAHYPRISIDNLAENQCKTYLDGKAHHFVELDPSCNLIRYV